MVERRGLGRGLAALFGESETGRAPGRPGFVIRETPIELLYANPDQPRRVFADSELDELAGSIKQRGVLQPILVRPIPGSGSEYQIVAGERRWRAAQRAGLHLVPIVVRELNDLESLEIALIENIQRTDLGALEEARGYAALIDRFCHSQGAVATIVGKSRSHIANTLRLLRLPQAVRDHLEAGRLSAGHARALIDHEAAEMLAERIVSRGLNVRQAEALARAGPRKGKSAEGTAEPAADADTRSLEHDLSEMLGLEVVIRDKNGAGEVRVRYQSLEQLDDLCRRLTRAPA
jgi:ParB family chromosome partitioning protein